MTKFIVYANNILDEKLVLPRKLEVEAQNIIDAAMMYYNKYGKLPTDITTSPLDDYKDGQIAALQRQIAAVRDQRDNFATSMNRAVQEREDMVQSLQNITVKAQKALAACTER